MNSINYKILLIGKDISSFKEELEIRNQTVYHYLDGISVLNAIENKEIKSIDTIILSINITGIKAWDLLRKIKSIMSVKDIPLIVISEFEEETTEIQALYLGADDYVSANISTKLLLAKIEANLRYRVYTNNLDNTFLENKSAIKKLTDREREILTLIVHGYTNKEIADRVFITSLTAANHVKNILKKLSLKNRTQAVLFAIKNNLMHVSL